MLLHPKDHSKPLEEEMETTAWRESLGMAVWILWEMRRLVVKRMQRRQGQERIQKKRSSLVEANNMPNIKSLGLIEVPVADLGAMPPSLAT